MAKKRARAIFPVMPSGVEHLGLVSKLNFATHAIFPVMPSGVEHILPAAVASGAGGDFSCDAFGR